MRLLFDQRMPVPLRRHLVGHSVDTAADRGWSDLDNGNLIERAEEDGYEVLIGQKGVASRLAGPSAEKA